MTQQWGVLPYAIVFTLYLVMFAVVIVLYMKWRNKHYLNFVGVLAFSGLLSFISYLFYDYLNDFTLFIAALVGCSFVAQQVSFMRLYQPRREERQYIHLAGVILFGLLASNALSNQSLFFSYILLILSLGFSAYSFFLTSRLFGRRLKYLAAISCFAMYNLLLWLSFVINNNGIKHFSMFLFAGAQFALFLLLIERMIELMQAATYSSSRDESTGLHNNKYFIQLSNQYLQANKMTGFIYVELNGADQYLLDKGQEAYNKLLGIIGELVKECCGSNGSGGRLDDRSVALIIFQSSLTVASIAEELRKRIEEVTDITASIGYVVGGNGMDLPTILGQAKQSAEIASEAGNKMAVGQQLKKSVS